MLPSLFSSLCVAWKLRVLCLYFVQGTCLCMSPLLPVCVSLVVVVIIVDPTPANEAANVVLV